MSGVELFTIGSTVVSLADALSVAGVLASTAGVISQGKAAKSQANLQARINEQRAAREKEQAAADESDFRSEQSRLLARRRAALGAAGVDPSTGSPLLVSEDFAGEVELQALRIRSGGAVRSTRLQQEAGLIRSAGRSAKRAGVARGGALLLEGAGKVFA